MLATAERQLLYAVIQTAVEDLTSTNEIDKFEAHEFLFQPKGKWADQRRTYFNILGIDEVAFQERISYLFDPPEKPSRKWTAGDIYKVLPNGPFKGKDLEREVTLRYNQITGRIHNLLDRGLITRLDRGLFIRTDRYDDWLADNPPKPPVLDALEKGPLSVREIGWALDGEMDTSTIREKLMQAAENGLVERDGSTWKLAA